MGSLTFPGLVAFLVVLSTGLAVGAMTAAVGYPMGMELTAYLVAVALAVAFTERPVLGTGAANTALGRRLRATGLTMLALGVGAGVMPVAMVHQLVHPLFLVGLVSLFGGHLLDWRWGEPLSSERLSFVLLAIAGTLFGYFAHQEVFLAAGALALLISVYAVVLEHMPPELAGLWRYLLPGAMSLAILIVARAHISMIIQLVKACFRGLI